MKMILEWKVPLARCYFANNDLIAIGAMQALRKFGLRIPEDVVVETPLTTVHVPQSFMEELAARIDNPGLPVVKTEVRTSLVDQYSC